jgi:hypothetical protein
MRRDETITEQLRYKFTPDEHLVNCEQLAAKLDHQSELEVDHKAIKTNLKEREDKVAAEIGKLTRQVRDKFELRDVQCRWDYGRPTGEQKTLIRLDTNEDVRVERMLDHERQEVLKFEMPSHVLSGPGSFKDMRVVDMEQSDVDYLSNRDESDLSKFGWIEADIQAVFAEARRRGDEAAAKGPVLVPDQTSSTEAVAEQSLAVHESGLQFVGEAVIAEEPAAAAAEPEAPHTLGSAREIDGGTHAEAGAKQRGRRGSKVTSIAPLSEEERAHLEAVQQQQEEEFGEAARNEAPEL